jgi:hypothetical protein
MKIQISTSKNYADTSLTKVSFLRESIAFTVLVMILAVGISLIPPLTSFYMFTPAIAALLTLLLSGRIKTDWIRTLGIQSMDL